MNKREHQNEAESHIAQGKNFAALSEQLSAAADSMNETEAGTEALRSGSDTCKKISDQHISDGSRHLDCMKSEGDELEKSEGGDEMKKLTSIVERLEKALIPSNVSVVPRFDNPTLVPRKGAPSASDREAIAKVEPQLAGVLGIGS